MGLQPQVCAAEMKVTQSSNWFGSSAALKNVNLAQITPKYCSLEQSAQ
jgi:hypothetical protein